MTINGSSRTFFCNKTQVAPVKQQLPEQAMKRNIPTFITLISLIIAATSVSLAIKAGKQRKLAQAEAESLRQQIAEQNNHPPIQPESPAPSPALQEIQTNTQSVATLHEAAIQPEQQRRRERPDRESFEERMAQLKAEDPEAYAEMIQRRQERQQEMRYNLAERTATFMDLDTTYMTEEELVNHELLVEKMAKIFELTEQFQDPEQRPDREAMRELFEQYREVRHMLELERNVMFKQLGSDLGYEEEGAREFAAHVEDIISATTLQMPRGGRGGGGQRGGGDRAGNR
jgi:hypothetical protein